MSSATPSPSAGSLKTPSPTHSSATPSPLNQYPPELRGSKEFQRELTSISGRLSQPISPNSAITPEGAANIARVESAMRASGSSSLGLQLDPNSTPEDYNREKNLYSWRNKKTGPSVPSPFDLDDLFNRPLPPMSEEEANARINQLLQERKAKLRLGQDSAHVPIEISESSTDNSLGSAFYAKRKGKAVARIASPQDEFDQDDKDEVTSSHWSYDSPASEEVADVSKEIDFCNYTYVPEPSPVPYEPVKQPELEGVVFLKKRIIPDGDESSSAFHEDGKILACRDMSTSMTDDSLRDLVEQFRPEGRIILPAPHMRCYHFNHPENGGRAPRMVLSAFLLKLGISAPLHPFIQEILEYYGLAPLQINPNGYRSAIALYILYKKQGYPTLTARQLGYFLNLKHSAEFGYFYLSVWPYYNKKKLIYGGPSNSGKWKDPFFYVHEVPRVQTHFYYDPEPPVRTSLQGQEKVNADNLLKIPVSERNIRKLITTANLVEYGFLKEGTRLTPSKKSKKRKGMAISPPPFLDEPEVQIRTVPSGSQAGSHAEGSNKVIRTKEIPPRKATLTEYLATGGVSPLKRKNKHAKDSAPELDVVKRARKDLPPTPQGNVVASTLVRLGAPHVSESDLRAWTSGSFEANNDALSKATAEVFIR
ncbi:hypothetical protein POM88_011230 [Heracleum sosnowskyi]|uniref:Transposase (putative) gypsy type domain-containing protein n=1 Tax=Heracleum sosnowskyi TaxID=360622 RepID=A0AAD8IVW7_9APIA|nr:hypothetical protein POM88_011230 [Heracleum sosnowskyi]